MITCLERAHILKDAEETADTRKLLWDEEVQMLSLCEREFIRFKKRFFNLLEAM